LTATAGHVLIAKYVASQLADVFEELELVEEQQQQQQQSQFVPGPLLFKSAEAASMKSICLVRPSPYFQQSFSLRLATACARSHAT
jgi:hypothetical protein